MSAQTEFDFEARKEEFRQASAAIIERIKKLLRLAADKRGNRHEAERAMAMAYELAEKHRVDVAALDLDEESARLIHEEWPMGMRFDQLRRGIFGILQTYFHVTICLRKPEMLVIGKPTDVMIARYVHDFLMRAARACLREFEALEKLNRRRMTTAKRAGYIAGFIYGQHQNLQGTREAMPLSDAQTALVVSEDAARESKLEELVPQRSKVKALEGRHNTSALQAGWRDGRATKINQPLAGTASGPLLLK